MDASIDPNNYITFLAGRRRRHFRLHKSSISALSQLLHNLVISSTDNIIDWSHVDYQTFLAFYRYACCHDYTFPTPAWMNELDDSPREFVSPVSSKPSLNRTVSSIQLRSMGDDFTNICLDSDGESVYDEENSSLPASTTTIFDSSRVFRRTVRLYMLAAEWSVHDLCIVMLQRLDRLFASVLENHISFDDCMSDLLFMTRIIYGDAMPSLLMETEAATATADDPASTPATVLIAAPRGDPVREMIANFFIEVFDKATEHEAFLDMGEGLLEFQDDLVRANPDVLRANGAIVWYEKRDEE